MQDILSYYINISALEWIAVVASLLYVILAAYQHRLCWPAAIVSTVAYSIVFYEYYLWSDSALQIYYLVMALYGWYCWRPQRIKQHDVEDITLSISTRPLGYHVKAIGILILLSLLLGYLMKTFTPTDFPYLDAATTVFAIFTTYLVTQKILENWLYWIVIDFVSIYLYTQKSLTPTAFLFGVFVVIAGFGYMKWLSLYKASIACHEK